MISDDPYCNQHDMSRLVAHNRDKTLYSYLDRVEAGACELKLLCAYVGQIGIRGLRTGDSTFFKRLDHGSESRVHIRVDIV